MIGRREVVRLLLRHRADINAENNIGETPLHLAVRHGKTEIVDLLLKNGANINAITICGDTPLQLAKSKNHTEIIQLLESAAQEESDLRLAALNERTDVVDSLLERGANINAKDRHGYTILHHAAMNRKTEVVELLLKRGADIYAKELCGKTPLHLAADRGHTEVVELLLQHRANIHEKDQDGKTPLHWAAVEGKTETVALLLKNGADIEAKDNFGQTLQLAESKNHTEIIQLFKSAAQKSQYPLGASALTQASANLEGRGTTGTAEAGNTTGAAAEEGKGEELGDIALKVNLHKKKSIHNALIYFRVLGSNLQSLHFLSLLLPLFIWVATAFIRDQCAVIFAIMPSLASLSSIIYA